MSSACTSVSPPSKNRGVRSLRSGGSALAFLLVLPFLLPACAAPSPRAPRLERLSSDSVIAEAHSPTSSLKLSDLVAAAHAGVPPDVVVQRWRDDGARLPLDASVIVELHVRGVSTTYLDALLAAREQAWRTDYETRLAVQRANADAALAAERSRVQQCSATYGPYPYWGPFPYAGWGSPGGWYGGLRFSW